MHEVMSLSMLCDADVTALRSYLRGQYRASHDSCCVSLLSLSYVGFERQCRASIRRAAAAGFDYDDNAFGAHVCAGLKLEYSAQRVVVRRSLALMPAAPALVPVLGKRSAADMDAPAAMTSTTRGI